MSIEQALVKNAKIYNLSEKGNPENQNTLFLLSRNDIHK